MRARFRVTPKLASKPGIVRRRGALGRRWAGRPRLIRARAAPARYHELAGRVEMSLLERAPGASLDRVGVEGRTSMAVRMRSDELQTRRFEFFAPSHISWPVVDDKARPCTDLSLVRCGDIEQLMLSGRRTCAYITHLGERISLTPV